MKKQPITIPPSSQDQNSALITMPTKPASMPIKNPGAPAAFAPKKKKPISSIDELRKVANNVINKK